MQPSKMNKFPKPALGDSKTESMGSATADVTIIKVKYFFFCSGKKKHITCKILYFNQGLTYQ